MHNEVGWQTIELTDKVSGGLGAVEERGKSLNNEEKRCEKLSCPLPSQILHAIQEKAMNAFIFGKAVQVFKGSRSGKPMGTGGGIRR